MFRGAIILIKSNRIDILLWFINDSMNKTELHIIIAVQITIFYQGNMIKTMKQFKRPPSNHKPQKKQQVVIHAILPQQSKKDNNNNTNNSSPNTNFSSPNTNNSSPKFTQEQFMKYYQQNIRIKKELEEKNSQIALLRTKLENQLSLNHTTSYHPYAELKQLKNQVKKTGPGRGQSGAKDKGRTFYGTTSTQQRKLENLLEIIESYKQKLLVSEEQCLNLQRQKTLLQQQIKVGNRKQSLPSLQQSDSYSNSQSKYDQLLAKLRQKTSQLQLQKQRNKFVQAQLRRIESKQRTLEMDSENLEELKVQNRILQERIMKLTLFTDSPDPNRDYRSLEDKNRELQTKIKAGLEKYNQIKQHKTKIEIDYKLLQNKLIELQHQLQQTQQQNLILKKNEVNDPLIQRLIKDKLLLAQVIGEIQQPRSSNINNQYTSFQSTHQLLLQKQALAKQLIEVKNKIKLLEETWRQKETMIQLERQQMLTQLKNAPSNNNLATLKNAKTYTSKQGIQYDGDISMFSDQRTPITKAVNYFDIYLGKVNLIETLVKGMTPLSTSSPLLMATVDFYNFPTQNTKLSQGMAADLNTQFVFKVTQEEFFYKFLLKGDVKISVWGTQGNKNYLIGQVDMPLKQLILKNRPNLAPVVNTSAPIINGQKVLGTIFLDMRMRLPIYEQSSKIMSQPLDVLQQKSSSSQERKLIIQIEEGSGFRQGSKLFVYYQFRLEDYYTKTSLGPLPKWGHYKMIDLRYDEEIKNYLKKNQLQFTVFDDSVGMDDKDSDVVGTAMVGLMQLLEGKVVREKLQVRKNGILTGTIQVKLFWYEHTKQKNSLQQASQKLSKVQLLESLHYDILNHISLAGSSAERQFKRIDTNSTGMISFDQFNMWVIRIKLSHKYSRQLISMYYDTFQQPLNLINWVIRLSARIQDKHDNAELVPQLSQINQILKKNSVQINTGVSLREYLKDKDMLNVTLDIDSNKNGEISRHQLIDYMNKHNIVVDESEIQGQSVNLVSFLKKYGR